MADSVTLHQCGETLQSLREKEKRKKLTKTNMPWHTLDRKPPALPRLQIAPQRNGQLAARPTEDQICTVGPASRIERTRTHRTKNRRLTLQSCRSKGQRLAIDSLSAKTRFTRGAATFSTSTATSTSGAMKEKATGQ